MNSEKFKPLKIVYYGSSDFSLPILEKLIHSEFEVVLVITQPDKQKGRGKKVIPTPVKVFAEQHGIEVWTPKTLKSEQFLTQYQQVHHDIAVVASYGKIIPPQVLTVPRFGYLNVHASLLPKYRGASPIHGAILHGEKKTGITIMRMDEGLDTGDIMIMSEIPVLETDDIFSLTKKLASLGGDDIVKALRSIQEKSAVYIPQNHTEASMTKKVSKEEGIITWQETSQELIQKDKAYRGWPGLQTQFRGKSILLEGFEKVNNSEFFDDSFVKEAQCGTIVFLTKKEFFIKVCDGLVKVRKLKIAGKKKIDTQSFLSGYKPKVGETFGKQ